MIDLLLSKKPEVYLDGDLEKSADFYKAEKGIQINVNPQKAFNLQNVMVVFPDSVIVQDLEKIKYKVYLNGKEVQFIILSEHEKAAIKAAYPISA